MSVRSDPEFAEAFARSLGTFLSAMDFRGGVAVEDCRIVVHVTDDLAIYLDVRAERRGAVVIRRPRRYSHLRLVEPTPGDEAG